MKKAIALGVASMLCISFHVAAQCGSSKNTVYKKCGKSEKTAKSKESKTDFKWRAFVEPVLQFGLCGSGNPVGLIAGVEKNVTKHVSVSADVQLWKTNYENWCCDMHTVGKYSTVIPSVKFKLDPGKQDRGFFIGGGIGYALVRDRGMEEPYTYDPVTGSTKTDGSGMTPGNWDVNTIAPSFQWGAGFKAFKLPVALVHTTYWGNTSEGFMAIASGMGIKIGLNKMKETKSGKTKKSCQTRSYKPGCGAKKMD